MRSTFCSLARHVLLLPSFLPLRNPTRSFPQNHRGKKQGKTSQFAPFGAGVTSYFKLLKYFSWSFLVVSFLILPLLVVNTSGDAITTVTTNTDKMSWTTVGNLGGGRGNLSSVVGLSFSQKREAAAVCRCRATGVVTHFRVARRHRAYLRALFPTPPSPVSPLSSLVSKCRATYHM